MKLFGRGSRTPGAFGLSYWLSYWPALDLFGRACVPLPRWTFEQPDPAFATAESPAGQRYVSDEPGFPFELQFGDTDTDCTAHFVAPDGEWVSARHALCGRALCREETRCPPR